MLSTTNTEMNFVEESHHGKEELGLQDLALEAAQVSSSLFLSTEPAGKKQTPAASRRESTGGESSSLLASGKRRGRPRGWTDARIHQILTYLERNVAGYKSTPHPEFYTALCMSLGYDLGECQEIQEKAEKMVKKYEADTRRGDASWKWYARMNQVFGGPPLAPYAGSGLGGRVADDDDAASSSLESADEEGSGVDGGEPLRRRARGEDPFQDRLEHEKLLLKLKKLKSKTEMRHREWEAAMEKQSIAFEEMKMKMASGVARLEKAIINAGYELDQSEMIIEQQQHQQ